MNELSQCKRVLNASLIFPKLERKLNLFMTHEDKACTMLPTVEINDFRNDRAIGQQVKKNILKDDGTWMRSRG